MRERFEIPWVAVGALLVAGCAERQELAPADKAEPHAEVSISPARVKIAEPFELEISVAHPKSTEAKLPHVGAELEALEVVKTGKVKTRHLEPGVRLTERMLTLRGFRAGAYTLGPFKIVLASEAGLSGTLSTPKAQVEVYSVVSRGSRLDDLKPSKGPFELPPAPLRWGVAAALVLGALALMAAGALVVRRAAARRAEIRRAPPPVPPDAVALEELRRIRESGILDKGHIAEYTDKVSDVLRRYLEARFSLPAPERTTEEFLDEIARAPVLDRERKRFLADYLAQCDLVKFAAQDPGRRELEELYEDSVTFVRETADRRRARAAAEG